MLYAQPLASQRQKYKTEYDLEELMGLTDSSELACSMSVDDSWLKPPYPIKLSYQIPLRSARKRPLTSDLDSITKQLRRTREELNAAKTRLEGVPSCPPSRLTNYSEPPNGIAELLKPYIEEILARSSKPTSPLPMTFGASSLCASPRAELETEQIEPLFEKPGYSLPAREKQPLSTSTAMTLGTNSLATSHKLELEKTEALSKHLTTSLGVETAGSLSIICKAEQKPKLIRLTCSCMLTQAVKRHDRDCRPVACYQVTRAPRRKPSIVTAVLIIQKAFRSYLARKKSYSITKTSQTPLIEYSNPATPDLVDNFVRTPVRIKSTTSLRKSAQKQVRPMKRTSTMHAQVESRLPETTKLYFSRLHQRLHSK
jgi:hypothetical protein